MNYQEKVSTRADVKALFEKVKENPAVARYRGYTDSKSYGWDEKAGDYIKCEGEVWFENPSYDADFVTVGEPNAESTELLDEQLLECRERIVALEAECSALRSKAELADHALAAANAALDEAIAKKNAVCAILCNLKEVLEKVLAYRAE
ncbi:MAG: hypothetical protein IJW51_04905 [Clostridia bacterium]|nr:hypothetical protein [Clostridia bacterium]MBQ9802389.1 hypothetical protein [Clostridia bacterium]